MVATRPVTRGVDHIIIRTDHAEPLCSLLSDTFQLPVSWPVVQHPWFASTGICAGNVDLEIIHFGPCSDAPSVPDPRAAYSGIALLPDTSLSGCQDELARRGVPHSAPVPYARPGGNGGETRLWSSVYLAGLAGHGWWMGMVISLSKLLPEACWTGMSAPGAFVRPSWVRALFETMCRSGMLFLVDYEPRFCESLDECRAFGRAALHVKQGGPLGLRMVKTIVVGVKNWRRAEKSWQKLLAPERPTGPGVWSLGNELVLRLVPHAGDALLGLEMEVASLESASRFLTEHGLLGDVSDQRVEIDPSRTQGLGIWLVEPGASPVIGAIS